MAHLCSKCTFNPFDLANGLKVKYTFNSYRLTYRYHFINNDTWNIGIGLTAKIRDAGIRLQDNNTSAEKTNLGIVPLINFYAKWNPCKQLGILIEGDGLATPKARRACLCDAW